MNEIGETLVSALMRTGLFLSVSVVVVFLLFRLFRVASPAVRRWACCIFLLQGWFFVQWPVEIPILPASDSEVAGGRSQGFWKSLGSEGSLSDREQEVSNSKIPYPLTHNPFLEAASVTIETAEVSIQSGNVSWPVCLVFLWGAGILVISCRTLWMYVRFVRELPPEQSTKADWESEWKSLQRQSALRIFIPLYITEQTGPMLCRFPRGYRLIVPANLWRDLSLSQRLSILQHELAHVQRHDVWKSLAVRVLALPHWFNPLVWWVVKQFDECAEWACDEEARKATPGHASDYARALVLLGAPSSPVSSLHPAARGRGLAFRVRRLLVSNDLEDSRMKKFSFAMLVLGVSLFGLMKFQLVADEPQKATAADPSATKSDSTLPGLRISVPGMGPTPLAFGFGHELNSDTAISDKYVFSIGFDDVQAVEKSSAYKAYAPARPILLRVGDDKTANYVIGEIKGNKYVLEKDSSRKAALNANSFLGKEAVIDMAYLFKNLDEFKRGRNKMKDHIASASKELRDQTDGLKALQERLSKLRQEKSAENEMIVKILEKELNRKKAVIEETQKASQKDFLRQEAQLYQKTYNIIAAEVAKYARERGIKIVRRTTKTTQHKKEIDESDPKEILRRINQPIVYIESNELDITEEILKRLQPKKKKSSTKSVRN